MQRSKLFDKSSKKNKYSIDGDLYLLTLGEIVRCLHTKVNNLDELHWTLHDLGKTTGGHLCDHIQTQTRANKRETKFLNMLIYVKQTLWKFLFGAEVDRLERAEDDEVTYYIRDDNNFYNSYISESEGFNNAYFMAGFLESFISLSGFACHVTAHHHEGTTFKIVFDDKVIQGEKLIEELK